MKTIILSILSGCLAATPLLAQEKGGGEPRQATGRVAYFVYTSMPEDLENPVTVMTGKELLQLTLSKRSASEPVKIPADGIVRIVRKTANPNDPAKPIYLTLAQAQIPEGVAKALVILVPAAKAQSGLLFQAKVQDLAAFKGGDTLYLNLTTLNVGVEMGATKIGLKPGDTRIFTAPEMAEATNMEVRYSYYHPTQLKWNMLSASTVVLRSTRREICIFSWDPRFNRVDYHGIIFPVTPDSKS